MKGMKYRLKDRALQEKLDALSNGEFTKNLHSWSEEKDGGESKIWCSYWGKNIHWETWDEMEEETYQGKNPQFEVWFYFSDLEEVPEYDPHKWNEWPGVEPPEDTLLRIEVITKRIDWDTPEPRGGKVRCRGCATYRSGFWMLGEKIQLNEGETIRFRPWVDPDEEGEK